MTRFIVLFFAVVLPGLALAQTPAPPGAATWAVPPLPINAPAMG